jgi:hypothetical protein
MPMNSYSLRLPRCRFSLGFSAQTLAYWLFPRHRQSFLGNPLDMQPAMRYQRLHQRNVMTYAPYQVIYGCCTRYRFPPCRTTRTGRYHTCICFHPDMQKGFSFSLSLLYQMRRIRWVKRLWPNKDEGKRAIRSGRIMRFWDVYNRSEQ